MENKFEDQRLLDQIDENKRDFMKRVIVGSAFAVPLINSFSMDGLRIDLGTRMARADEFDKPGALDASSDKGGKGGGVCCS